jgi:hypothetical protein
MKYGYKAFDNDLKCRDYQFEIGKLYEISEPIKICNTGFHYCENLKDVYEYYPKEEKTRVCKVIDLSSETVKEGDKSCTNKLLILEEIPLNTLKSLTDNFRFNSGDYNSGNHNSGDYNSGNHNSGDYNSGNHNSGYRNSGDYNSGYRNSGDYNSGDYNSGDYNSGNHNSGDYNSGNHNSGNHNSGNRNSGYRNSGHYNSGNRNSGYFNSITPPVTLFNKPTKLKHDSEKLQQLNSIIHSKWKEHLAWVPESQMTDEEKTANPSHKTTGGYLKKTANSYFKSWENVVKQLSDEEKKFIKSLPNFSNKVFKQITGQTL